jgi:hypothetical protein
MQRTTNGVFGNENQSEVYAIFRVSNLGNDEMGVRIYVDPETKRKTHKLTFAVEKYSVIPALG